MVFKDVSTKRWSEIFSLVGYKGKRGKIIGRVDGVPSGNGLLTRRRTIWKTRGYEPVVVWQLLLNNEPVISVFNPEGASTPQTNNVKIEIAEGH